MALIVLTFAETPAYAHFLGGKWGDRSPAIYEGLSHADSYVDPFYHQGWNNAKGAWDYAYSTYGLQFRYDTAPENYAEITLKNADYGDITWDGFGQSGPDPYSGTYLYGSIKINDYRLEGLSYVEVGAVISHEMGHVAGLAHPPDGTDSIMYRYNMSIWNLKSHDITDIQTLYP